MVCYNERVTEGILRYLLEYFPNAANALSCGSTPVHLICGNKNVTLGMVQLLIDATPNPNRENINGCMPLHSLCRNKHLDEDVRLEILQLLLQKYPESARHAVGIGNLPIHLHLQIAPEFQSLEFCRTLIQSYPESVRMATEDGMLPFHKAFNRRSRLSFATAEVLYQLYPGSINVADNEGKYPIHYAIMDIKYRNGPEVAIKKVRFLLDRDPDVALQKYGGGDDDDLDDDDGAPWWQERRRNRNNGKLPLCWVLHKLDDWKWVCATNEDPRLNAKLNAILNVLQMLYDVYPEAIESNEVTTFNVTAFHPKIQTFINTQLNYARQARDRTFMNTRDENGQLSLHKALRDDATLGSIKLLVKSNPSAISCADNKGMMPLHVACQYHESASIVEYLISLNEVALRTTDEEENTALHHACIGASHEIIALLIAKHGLLSVAKRNAHNQLPIDLLLQNKNEVSDKQSVEYTESIYRLLRAYPVALMHYDLGQTGSEQNKKKRKIDEVYGMCIIQ